MQALSRPQRDRRSLLRDLPWNDEAVCVRTPHEANGRSAPGRRRRRRLLHQAALAAFARRDVARGNQPPQAHLRLAPADWPARPPHGRGAAHRVDLVGRRIGEGLLPAHGSLVGLAVAAADRARVVWRPTAAAARGKQFLVAERARGPARLRSDPGSDPATGRGIPAAERERPQARTRAGGGGRRGRCGDLHPRAGRGSLGVAVVAMDRRRVRPGDAGPAGNRSALQQHRADLVLRRGGLAALGHHRLELGAAAEPQILR